jgi:hypothetical protein
MNALCMLSACSLDALRRVHSGTYLHVLTLHRESDHVERPPEHAAQDVGVPEGRARVLSRCCMLAVVSSMDYQPQYSCAVMMLCGAIAVLCGAMKRTDLRSENCVGSCTNSCRGLPEGIDAM